VSEETTIGVKRLYRSVPLLIREAWHHDRRITPQKVLKTMNAINPADKLSTFSEYWQPRVVGSFNGHDLMVVKVKGVEHRPVAEDEAHVLLIEPRGTPNTGSYG
jgi:hypothetical protein